MDERDDAVSKFVDAVVRDGEEAEDALRELEWLADEDPSLLTPHLERLLVSLEWGPPVASMFAGADDAVQRLLVEQVDTWEYIGGPLAALAQARGPVAEAAFRRWREEPPSGMERLYVSVEEYARTGDWELAPEGIRELCGSAVFALDREAAAEVACTTCDRPLDALLDVDTRTDPDAAEALAHSGWSGRLRIALCERCHSSPDTLLLRVTPEGDCARTTEEALREEAAHTPPAQPGSPIPKPRRTLGERRAEFRSHDSALGGRPLRMPYDDAAYPTCPGCDTTMDYIAQFDSGDDLTDWYDTLFLHAPCGVAARATQG